MVDLSAWLPVALTDRQSISDLAGSASFTIWLFAQSPQLLENYRRGSIEGLSPVFLVQWMLGDATNLIGCILTGQLPFQIAVATYFCCVDLCITVQYIYYWRMARSRMQRTLSTIVRPVRSRMGSLVNYQAARHPFAIAPTETSLLLASSSSRRMHDRGSRSPTVRYGNSSRPLASRTGSEEMGDSIHSQTATYRALRDAAMSVAQLVDEAAFYFDGVHTHHTHHHPHQPSQQPRDRSHSNYGTSRRATATAAEMTGTSTSVSRSSSCHSTLRAHSSHRLQAAYWTPATLGSTIEKRMPQSDSEEDGDEVPLAMLQSTTSLQSRTSTRSSASVTRSSSSSSPAHSRRHSQTHSQQQHQVEGLADGGRRGRDMTRTAIRLGLVANDEETPSLTPSDGTAHCAGRREALSDHPSPSAAGPNADMRPSSKETHFVLPVPLAEEAAEGPLEPLLPVAEEVTSAAEDGGYETTSKRRVDRSGSWPAKSRTRSSHSVRRGFGMMLMGLMLVVALAEGPEGVMTWPTSNGSGRAIGHSGLGDVARRAVRLVLDKVRHPASLYLSTLRSTTGGGASTFHLLDTPPLPAPTPPPGPSWDRIIGRLSAWTCTILYMTSRLPQIWENHMRRSVAGLSILLFVAAFLGNLTYSISILVSPSAVGEGAREYIQECLPFLLGSGGTLVFDAIIVVQWWLWSGRGSGLAPGEEGEGMKTGDLMTASLALAGSGAGQQRGGLRTKGGKGGVERRWKKRRERESLKRSWQDATNGGGTMSKSVVLPLPSHQHGLREDGEVERDAREEEVEERMTMSVPGLQM